jgi:hypothetical protein
MKPVKKTFPISKFMPTLDRINNKDSGIFDEICKKKNAKDASSIMTAIKEAYALSKFEPIMLSRKEGHGSGHPPYIIPPYSRWLFQDFLYDVTGYIQDEEAKLLVLEEFGRERKFFEKLRIKFSAEEQKGSTITRPRIPEKVRVEVWRRDGGKRARCGSREKLEYDHIVPVSRGGSNTARNIELLCEKCNRSKKDNVV